MTQEKIETNKLNSETEKNIVKLIDAKGKCLLGEILMELKLSYQKGYQTINKLVEKEIINNTKEPPYYTLK